MAHPSHMPMTSPTTSNIKSITFHRMRTMTIQIAPSILSADFCNLERDLKAISNADLVHVDVMDHHFVPNLTLGEPIVARICQVTDLPVDVHLMIEEPGRYIEDFVGAGADLITVHAESCKHLDRTIASIKERGILAGVALNPATPLQTVEYVLEKVDMVLIMTVNPGFGGQKFIPYTLQKVRDLKKMIDARGLKTDIEVDGGVNLSNVEEIMSAGANIIVAGSAVFNGDVAENTQMFLDILNS